ncbi:MAG: hypothetical protein M1838_005404 [Thelocarpon superellum]|nr:MAG: hypothetical protein M1838_005404 [Thelocarpon superellum]
MSSTNQGRQSPDPERQSGAQQQDAPSSGKFADGGSFDGSNAGNQQQSEKTKAEGLESNPTSAMDAKADQATGKDGRGVEN